jgi:hypothetical protein
VRTARSIDRRLPLDVPYGQVVDSSERPTWLRGTSGWPRWISADDAADRLGVPRGLPEQLARLGYLTRSRFNGLSFRPYFRVDEIEHLKRLSGERELTIELARALATQA